MSLNKTSLALVITIALNSTAAEVDAIFDEARETLGFAPDNSIAPGDIATGTTQQAATGTSGELDSKGLPWDARIHSSNKKKTADGSWWGRKGVDDGLRTKVEAELRATMAAPAAASQQTVAAAGVPTTLPPLPAAAPPSIPLPPLPVAPPANPVFTNFVSFLAQHTKSEANPNGRLTDEWVKQTLAVNGVAGGELQNLAHNPALIPQIEAGIKAALGIA